jgi:shikimate kinase
VRIALVGYMGSGKSTMGRLLAKQMNIPFIDLDERIELVEGTSVADIFITKGEAYFRALESAMLTEILVREKSYVLATGGGTPCFFQQMQLLNERCVTVYLRCSSSVLQARLIDSSQSRPVLSNLSHGISEHLMEREKIYSQAQIIVNGELPILGLSQYIQRLLI